MKWNQSILFLVSFLIFPALFSAQEEHKEHAHVIDMPQTFAKNSLRGVATVSKALRECNFPYRTQRKQKSNYFVSQEIPTALAVIFCF